MILRQATPDDVETLAHIHVTAWQETYADLLPPEVIAAQTIARRRSIWQKMLSQDHGRIWLLDDVGFAHFGPQRETEWRDRGYPEELYAIYLLRAGYGRGQDLLTAAFGPEGQPFTACVLTGNVRACAFYERLGGRILATRNEHVGAAPITEHIYGWTKLKP